MVNQIILTSDGLDKLKAELKDLQDIRRPSVIERLQAARALGDLSENSEYDDARNEQSFIEGRIQELKGMIKYAKIVSKNTNRGAVSLGSKVNCQVDGGDETYEIVGSAEADPSQGKISIDSPLGKELVGKRPGEKARVQAPGGVIEYSIISIS